MKKWLSKETLDVLRNSCLILVEVSTEPGDYLINLNGFLFQDGLMDQYISNQKYNAKWTLLESESMTEKPPKRGDHQLVLDTEKQIIYLYGGFDGMNDLSGEIKSVTLKLSKFSF